MSKGRPVIRAAWDLLSLRDLLHSQAAPHAFAVAYPVMLAILIVAALAGIGRDADWQPLWLTHRFDGGLLRYYLFSIALGLIVGFGTYGVRFKVRGARPVFETALFALTTVATIIGIVDNFNVLRVIWASFGAFLSVFALTYLGAAYGVKKSTQNNKAAANLNDFDSLTEITHQITHQCEPANARTRRLCQSTCRDLKRGDPYTAYLRLKWSSWRQALLRQPPVRNRELFKLRAMTYYRLGRCPRVIQLARSAQQQLAEIGQRPSSTLRGLEALAVIGLGDITTAKTILGEGMRDDPTSGYLKYCLAYAHWQAGEMDAALDHLAEAAMLYHEHMRWIVLGFRAHLLCDAALENPDLAAARRAADQANKALDEAFAARAAAGDDNIRWGVQLDHTLGYVRMLQGRYCEALGIFEHCVVSSSHLASRFRIGLLAMIGTRDYRLAINQFRWILNSLRLEAAFRQLWDPGTEIPYRQTFYRLVEANLERAKVAAARGVVFSDELVLHQLTRTIREVRLPVHYERVYRRGQRELPLRARLRIAEKEYADRCRALGLLLDDEENAGDMLQSEADEFFVDLARMHRRRLVSVGIVGIGIAFLGLPAPLLSTIYAALILASVVFSFRWQVSALRTVRDVGQRKSAQ